MRREPRQRRAQATIAAVLDAVERVIATRGAAALTTNRIAVAAGVSIGSVYQYFPDKRAIYAALLARHIEDGSRTLERALVAHAGASFEELLRVLVEVCADTHAGDPRLYAVLAAELPTAGTGFVDRIRAALRLALGRDDKKLHLLAHMIKSLGHDAVLHRPPGVSLAAAKAEAVRAVIAYARA